MLSSILRCLFVGLPVGATVVDCVGYVARVEGISMQPALNPLEGGSTTTSVDYVFISKWATRRHSIHRGDVVSLVSPKDPSEKFIKRVVAMEGDVIDTIGYKNKIIKIPDGHCWVEGDHTGHSLDSNSFGPICVGLVTGKASYIVWPPSRWQTIESFVPRTPLPNLI